MKKEKAKENKNILLIAGVIASIVMIVIVLSFSLSSITRSTMAGNAIREKDQQSINSKSIFNETLIVKELSGDGDAYLCINSVGKIFRSEIPCK
jgi:hypothetical protein